MERRDLLAGTAAVSSLSLSGCLGAIDPRRAEVELRRIEFANWTEQSIPVDVRVQRASEVVHEDAYELDPRRGRRLGGMVLDCHWDGIAGDYTVYARENGAEWISVSVTEVDSDVLETVDCVSVLGNLMREGGLALIVQQNCETISDSDTPCPVED